MILYWSKWRNPIENCYFVTKIVLTYCEKKLIKKFEAEGRDFANILRALEQQRKVNTILEN